MSNKSISQIILLTCLIGFFSTSNAQNEQAIAEKTRQLDTANAELAKAQALVNTLTGEIQALKPIIKWETGGYQAINFNQGTFTNWAKGGVNSYSITLLGNVFANYKFNNWTWVNNLDAAYGVLKNKGNNIRKNEDMINLTTKIGRKATPKLSWTSLMRFESQFADGYDFNDASETRPVISKFFAPAYVKASLGIDYKPNPKLSIYISPAAGKWTFVTDDSIAAKHLYIPVSHDNPNRRGEFGALFSSTYTNAKIIKNVGIKSTLELFNNYTDLNESNRKNIDIDWQTTVNLKISKYIGANIFTHLLYDNDTKIEYDPTEKPGVKGPRTQFKELFGVGFSYKF